MHNVLFLIEDSYKLNRIESVMGNDTGHKYFMFSNADEALETVKENRLHIAFLPASGTTELGREFAEVLYDSNPQIKFCFIYTSDDRDEVVALFNYFQDSRLVNEESLNVKTISEIINELERLIIQEAEYKKEFNKFRQIESSYKKKMLDISSTLNTRISCYENTRRIYLESYRYLFPEALGDSNNLFDYFSEQIECYFTFLLDRETDFGQFYESLKNKYHSKEEKRLYSLTMNDDNGISENSSVVAFVTKLICDAFYDFCVLYRGKVDIKFSESEAQIDIIYDLRASKAKPMTWNYVTKIIKGIVDSVSDKVIVVNRNGYMQYRVIIKNE